MTLILNRDMVVNGLLMVLILPGLLVLTRRMVLFGLLTLTSSLRVTISSLYLFIVYNFREMN
jgi:hypothetical protein